MLPKHTHTPKTQTHTHARVNPRLSSTAEYALSAAELGVELPYYEQVKKTVTELKLVWCELYDMPKKKL